MAIREDGEKELKDLINAFQAWRSTIPFMGLVMVLLDHLRLITVIIIIDSNDDDNDNKNNNNNNNNDINTYKYNDILYPGVTRSALVLGFHY